MLVGDRLGVGWGLFQGADLPGGSTVVSTTRRLETNGLCTLTMRWLPCNSSHQGRLPSVARFGHTCTVIDARDEWGTELIVLFGGVAASSAAADSDTAFPASANSADQQHTALADVLVLQAEADTWFAPDMAANGASASASFHASGGDASTSASPTAPEPRAFHAAAAVGKRVFVFGGHVLAAEAERKRRIFYSDLWSLDTVRSPTKVPPLPPLWPPSCCGSLQAPIHGPQAT